jgi:hypothetical protein
MSPLHECRQTKCRRFLIDRPTIDRPLQLIDLSSPAAKNTPAKIRPHCPGPGLLTSGDESGPDIR